MIEINWKKDYKDEFVCPHCHQFGMKFLRKTYSNNIKGAIFTCLNCNQNCKAPLVIKIKPVADLINKNVIWYTNHRIKGLICPDCQAENIYYAEIEKSTGAARFICRTCRKRCSASNTLKLNHD